MYFDKLYQLIFFYFTFLPLFFYINFRVDNTFPLFRAFGEFFFPWAQFYYYRRLPNGTVRYQMTIKATNCHRTTPMVAERYQKPPNNTDVTERCRLYRTAPGYKITSMKAMFDVRRSWSHRARDTAKMLRNQILYFKEIYKFSGSHFF